MVNIVTFVDFISVGAPEEQCHRVQIGDRKVWVAAYHQSPQPYHAFVLKMSAPRTYVHKGVRSGHQYITLQNKTFHDYQILLNRHGKAL